MSSIEFGLVLPAQPRRGMTREIYLKRMREGSGYCHRAFSLDLVCRSCAIPGCSGAGGLDGPDLHGSVLSLFSLWECCACSIVSQSRLAGENGGNCSVYE